MSDPRIDAALTIATHYGSIEGDHHRAWVIDQMVRALTATEDGRRDWIAAHNAGDEGPNTYSWDEGIAP